MAIKKFRKILIPLLFLTSAQCWGNEYASYANKIGLSEIVRCKLYTTYALELFNKYPDQVNQSNKWAIVVGINVYDILLENWNSLLIKGTVEAIRYKLNGENLSNSEIGDRGQACFTKIVDAAPPKLIEDAYNNGNRLKPAKF